MDFKVLKIDSIEIDDDYNIYYVNSNKERKHLEIKTPLLYLPFGLDKDSKNIYLNLQLRKIACPQNNKDIKLFLEFIENLEKLIQTKIQKEVKSVIRKNVKYDTIINTKVLKYKNRISTEVYKGKENYNLYNIEKEEYMNCDILIDKVWLYNDILYYKLKLKKIFIKSV